MKIISKVILFIAIATSNLALLTSNCHAQNYVTIPDSNFVTWLGKNGFASCLNGSQLDTTCSAVLNARKINCIRSNINSLTGIQYFKGLDTLICSVNLIDSLTTLPDSLQYLDCSFNNLDSLPVLPVTLTWMNCSNNELASLSALPSSFLWLNCSANQLDSLPALPSSLGYLNCSANLLVNLPGLSSSLRILNCSYNQVDSLPGLPGSLISLNCSGNQLTNLQGIPASLVSLYCSLNELDSLPGLPASLDTLDCDYNKITALPVLPSNLIFLGCGSNLITSLAPLPLSLLFLDVSYNAHLNCLPQINNIATLYFEFTNIQCVPGYGVVMNSNPVINTVPLCSDTNPNGCTATGINELTMDNGQLTIFPNPASGSFTISASEELNNAVVEIYTLVGEKVLSTRYQDIRQKTVDLSGFAAGIYFIRVSDGQQQFNKKLIVQ